MSLSRDAYGVEVLFIMVFHFRDAFGVESSCTGSAGNQLDDGLDRCRRALSTPCSQVMNDILPGIVDCVDVRTRCNELLHCIHAESRGGAMQRGPSRIVFSCHIPSVLEYALDDVAVLGDCCSMQRSLAI